MESEQMSQAFSPKNDLVKLTQALGLGLEFGQ